MAYHMSRLILWSLTLIATPTNFATAEDLQSSIERLRRSYKRLVSENRLPEALVVSRQLLTAYEQMFGPNDWRCRSTRLIVQENERYAALSQQQVTDLQTMKSKIETELKDGISHHCLRTLASSRVQAKVLLGDGPTYRQISEAAVVSFYATGDLKSALGIAEELVDSAKWIGEGSPEYARAAIELGFLLTCQGDVTAAEPLLRRATEVNFQRFGPDGVPFYDSIGRLAYLKLKQGNALDALLYSGLCMGGMARATGKDECELAVPVLTWASACASLGQNGQAQKGLERFLELTKDHMVPDHPLIKEAKAQLKTLAAPAVELGRGTRPLPN
jgi:tetratricopeptide (TPR) repeat protein